MEICRLSTRSSTETPSERIHEFRHFNVKVLNEPQTRIHSRQSFTFEINFRSFQLTNRLAETIHGLLGNKENCDCCPCCVGKSTALAIDLGYHDTLFVCIDEISRLRRLISKIKFDC